MRLRGPWRDFLSVAGFAREPQGGDIRLAGLTAAATVGTDRWGVPHIDASHERDLFFAQGYVTARDRLFQMDYNRRAARGRLCELLGRKPLPWRKLTVHLKERSTLDVDILLRSFGMEQAAQVSFARLSERARVILEAYAAGVNAWIERAEPTLEHRVLGVDVAPWEPIDSLALIKGIAFELNYAWRAILLGGLVERAQLPPAVARLLLPFFPSDGSPIVARGHWGEAASQLAGSTLAAQAFGIGSPPGAGSNCYAVAGSHTVDGAALLANDTHLQLTLPVAWHEVRLRGGEFDLHGFSLAGVPGIGIGRNPHLTWGITAGLVQDLDLYLEELSPDRMQYRTPLGLTPLAVREEVYRIRGEADVHRPVYSSHHGPFLETAATQPDRYGLAVCWTMHQPAREFDALVGLWTAQDGAGVREALRHHGCPTFNVTVAGADGRIAYHAVGMIPRRRTGTPMRPLEGWTGEWDWQGIVPYEENPSEVDPARGFIVTANNRIGPWDYPHELGQLFEPPDRFDRLMHCLKELDQRVTFADMVRLQTDVKALWALEVRAALLAAVGGPVGLGCDRQTLAYAAAVTWTQWDGEAGSTSPGASLGYLVPYLFAQRVLRRLVSEEATMAFLELSSFGGATIVAMVHAGELLASVGVDVAAEVRGAFAEAVERCRNAVGEDCSRWTWGAMHGLVLRHRFHDTPLGKFFSIGPEPIGGGPDTVGRGDFNFNISVDMRLGAAMRIVANARDRDQAGTAVAAGQSGDRRSRHYDDQVDLYVHGQLKTAPVTRTDFARRERLMPVADVATPAVDSSH